MRSVRCLLVPSVSISLVYVSMGSYPLNRGPAPVGSSIGSSYDSMPYLRIAPCLRLVLVVYATCIIACSSSSPPPLSPAVPSLWWRSCTDGPGLLIPMVYPCLFLAPSARLGGWIFFFSSLPRPVSTRHSVTLGGHSGGFIPLGQPFHSGIFGTPGDSSPPPTP